MRLASQPLISTAQIEQRVNELAQKISHDYQGKTLVIISILKGAFIFTADLVRRCQLPLKVEFMGVSSYKGTQSTGHVRITLDLSYDITGKHVLLVEDIIDTGKTIDYLLDLLRVRGPSSLNVCTLLSKPECHEMKHPIAYTGFEIANRFVVGYGLDFDGKYRELPYIAELLAEHG